MAIGRCLAARLRGRIGADRPRRPCHEASASAVLRLVRRDAGRRAVVFDVPVSNPVVLAAVLACPLMMIFMVAGGHRGGGRDRRDEPEHSMGDHTAIRGPAGREQGR
ncbi:DUF2933 domain-containing protein [Pseudonocardia bannensis]|uniref:DUF2933 domain-containing protein n=1 Tax=Pseudonocardia bannensis TaxID=630973 RepID=UPI0034D95A1E